MKPFFAVLFAHLTPFWVAAQFLATNNAPHTNPASHSLSENDWKIQQHNVDGHIVKKQLTQMTSTTSALATYLQYSCFYGNYPIPVLTAEYHSGRNSNSPQLKFGIRCAWDNGDAKLSITGNDMSPLLGEIMTVNQQTFLTMKAPAGMKKGCPYFETDETAENNGDVVLHKKAWLVTISDEQLPYTPVTRKEYLLAAKAELSGALKTMTDAIAKRTPVRSADVQEAEKNAMLEQLKKSYSGAALQVRTRMFLESYKTDEQTQEEDVKKETVAIQQTIAIADSLLQHMPEEELGKPACVSAGVTAFEGFEDGQYDRWLIKLNPAYFNAAIGNEKAQFFLVTWNYTDAGTEAKVIDKQLSEHVNHQQLRQFLPR